MLKKEQKSVFVEIFHVEICQCKMKVFRALEAHGKSKARMVFDTRSGINEI